MDKAGFKFTEGQRAKLLKCWPRKAEQKQAETFLDFAEGSISRWLPKRLKPGPTPVKEQIKKAERIGSAAREMVAALEDMPEDVAGHLNVGWLRRKYGEEYFRQHKEACRNDMGNQKARLYEVLANATAGQPISHRESERDKLPPDLPRMLPAILDTLKPLEDAAFDLANMTRDAKNWQNKELEQNLAISLALEYERIFEKPPSPANGSNFRKFAAELSKILGFELGAGTVAYACDAVRILRQTQRVT
jgi:hypothetical protein